MNGNNKKINFCLVGAGRMGARWAQIIFENASTGLASIVDINKEIGNELAKKYGVEYYSELGAESLAKADAVIVVTPHKYLFDCAKKALEAGKPVMIEKPGSKTVQEMIELVELAKKKGLQLMVNFNYRYFDAISKAKKFIDSGRIGEISFIRIRHGHGGRKGYENEWRMDKNIAGGGVTMDQGTHVIDLANWFLSPPIDVVKSLVSSKGWGTKVEDTSFILLKNEDNQIASLNVSIMQWKPIFFMEIIGTGGYCTVDGAGKKYGGREILATGVLQPDNSLKEEIIECNPNAENSLNALLNEFVMAIKEKREPQPNGTDALNMLKIVEKVYFENDL